MNFIDGDTKEMNKNSKMIANISLPQNKQSRKLANFKGFGGRLSQAMTIDWNQVNIYMNNWPWAKKRERYDGSNSTIGNNHELYYLMNIL